MGLVLVDLLCPSSRRLVAVPELTRVESFVPHRHGLPGRPVEDRAAPACAFVAREVFDTATTRAPDRRLEVDGALRRLCGWTGAGEVPSGVYVRFVRRRLLPAAISASSWNFLRPCPRNQASITAPASGRAHGAG